MIHNKNNYLIFRKSREGSGRISGGHGFAHGSVAGSSQHHNPQSHMYRAAKDSPEIQSDCHRDREGETAAGSQYCTRHPRKKVLVSEGDHVSEQDVLFEVDMEDLEEKILLKNRELEKLKLSLKDSREKSRLEQQNKNTEQSRAEEDYSRTKESLDAKVQQAYEALAEAQNRLEEFDSQSSGEQENLPDSVEEALIQASDEKHQLLEQAEADADQKKRS
ncbi:HlyD family secretion protein [Blautia sp. RD014234]|nr:HlyD family secretion protein [Blautia parvula]